MCAGTLRSQAEAKVNRERLGGPVGSLAEANYTDQNLHSSFIMSEGQIATHNERIDDQCLQLRSLQMLISVTRS